MFDTQNQNGRWSGNAPGYDEVYVLDVTSGPDTVTGVRVDGPDIHTFTKPTDGTAVDSTMPLDLAWSCNDTADTTSLRTDLIDNLSIATGASYTLPPGSLRAERDRTRQNQIEITRVNRVTPVGAAGGSELSVSITNDLDVLVQANPAL